MQEKEREGGGGAGSLKRVATGAWVGGYAVLVLCCSFCVYELKHVAIHITHTYTHIDHPQQATAWWAL